MNNYTFFSSLKSLSHSAFSLIELLIAVAIILTISGLSLVGYNNFNDRQTVNRAAATLASDLRLTQQKAISGEKPGSWCAPPLTLTGWHLTFPAGSLTYSIQGLCSNGSTSTSKSVTLTGVTRSPAAQGTVLFSTLQGSTAVSRTLTLTGTAAGSTSYSKVITVTPSGAVGVQ